MHLESKISNVNVQISFKEDYIHVFAEGKASLQQSIGLWQSIAEAIQTSECKYVLLEDYFDTGIRREVEALQFAKKLKALAIPFGCKFAVVCLEKKYQRNTFIASLATKFNRYEGKIFLSLPEAKSWLLQS